MSYPKFEEVQEKLLAAARRRLEVYNQRLYVELYTLEREFSFAIVPRDSVPPYQLWADIRFFYDALTSSATIFPDEKIFNREGEPIEPAVDLECRIVLPRLRPEFDLPGMYEEIKKKFDIPEMALIVSEHQEETQSHVESSLEYYWEIHGEDLSDDALYAEIFEEMKEILSWIEEKVRDYVVPDRVGPFPEEGPGTFSNN